jgi:translation elongation factor EF-G
MPDDISSQPLLSEIAIVPKSRAEQEKLGIALAKLVSEDPSLGCRPTKRPAKPF